MGEAIRVTPPESLQDARRIMGDSVDRYNARRLHSAIGYITPADRLAGRQDEVWAERDLEHDVVAQASTTTNTRPPRTGWRDLAAATSSDKSSETGSTADLHGTASPQRSHPRVAFTLDQHSGDQTGRAAGHQVW
jgi:hypothetical protein